MTISKTTLEAFEGFWAAYPRRPENPKAAARAVFARHVREGADPDAIIHGAKAYAAACARDGKDSKFIPHARTWLPQRRYEDWCEADVPASAPTAEPSPDHPLAWVRDYIGDAAWRSWIEPLTVELSSDAGGRVSIVQARTQFALERVKRDFGDVLAARLIRVAWRVAPKEPS